ncbi:hypothetical protein [Streptomyces sp. NBC_01207]|uniref:hypothetical protein n=1 Tax=Streptomyces sp. NBC_01207 TaxID=2903772 RepID=UPI002E12D7A4|nr:hypothetical protein OG457_26475 [Streptomyces sp. NBC_01207]
MITYRTADGSTITATPANTGMDLHLRNPEGRSVATVYMTRGDALRHLHALNAQKEK